MRPEEDFKHTFSMPKNLSVPSFRIGPAFCNIFTKGVISGSGSASFFLDDGELAPGFECVYQTVVLVTWYYDRNLHEKGSIRAELTEEPPLNLLKSPDIVRGRRQRCRLNSWPLSRMLIAEVEIRE